MFPSHPLFSFRRAGDIGEDAHNAACRVVGVVTVCEPLPGVVGIEFEADSLLRTHDDRVFTCPAVGELEAVPVQVEGVPHGG